MGFWYIYDFGTDGNLVQMGFWCRWDFCIEGISYGWDLTMEGIKFRGVSLYKALENSKTGKSLMIYNYKV